MLPRKHKGVSFGPHSKYQIPLHRRKLCWWGQPEESIIMSSDVDLLSLNKKRCKMSTLGERELYGQVAIWGRSIQAEQDCTGPAAPLLILLHGQKEKAGPGPPEGICQLIMSLYFHYFWALHLFKLSFSFPLREPSLLFLRVKNAFQCLSQY